MKILSSLIVAMALVPSLTAAERSGFELAVLVNQEERREYSARGKVYVEAVRGKSYELRLTNPLPYRVGVALSVDGLNTIDARHSSASSASKWVIDPYESIVISGWQVSDRAARQFFFTGESRSYGAALGQTDNLGVIEAVFFRERVPIAPYHREYDSEERSDNAMPRREAQAPPSVGTHGSATPAPSESKGKTSDDYAATGMGDRKHHAVERVDLDLESHPVATVRIRYEFRPQLVKLGIVPYSRSPLDRRERAHGFHGYSPEVDR